MIRSAQTTIKYICDYMRYTIEESMDEFRGDLNAIYLMGTTNIKSYLLRKKILLLFGGKG